MKKIIIKTIIILAVLYGFLLSIGMKYTWTYFTNLSNGFVAIVMFIFLIKDVLEYKGKKVKFPNWLYLIKFLSVISISLTGLVYMFILAPFQPGGFIAAYTMMLMGSFALHFLVPVLSVVDFIFFDKDYKPKKIHAIYAIIPPLMYVVFIVILGKCFNFRWGAMTTPMMAPYNFLNYGAPTGWFGFDLSQAGWTTLGIGVFYMVILLSLLFVGLGLLLIKFKKNK